MANVKDNVTLGKPAISGAVYRALLTNDLTIPTTVSADLAAAFKCLGYISEDGLTHTMENDTEDIKAWGGDTVLVVNNDRTDDFTFTLLEVMNEDVLKAVFGDSNVTVAAATSSAPKTISIASNADEQADCCWVVDMLMQGNNPKRIVIPKGKVTEIGKITYKDDDAVGYELTVRGAQDSAGNTHYEYMTIGSATT